MIGRHLKRKLRMPFTILGIGTAVPSAILEQQDAEKVAASLACASRAEESFIPCIYAGSGIARRHFCLGSQVLRDILDGTKFSNSPFLPTGRRDDMGPTTRQRMDLYEKEAPILALKATAKALSEAAVLPTEITHLVTVSCTGFAAPGFDWSLITELGMSPAVQRTHIGFMGCHAALNGLRVAHAFAASDPTARVLICSVELCSVHYHFGWDAPKVVANALFADGAAAAVGVGSEVAGKWRLVANGSRLIPEAADVMTWTVGDHGFAMTLSKKIPEVIAANLRPALQEWLGHRGLTIADINSWAIHPGGPKILDAAIGAVGIPPERVWASREILTNYGNMSSATGLFILKKLMDAGTRGPCVAIGFGPGLNVEMALFE
jgi:predicted naringenin-chalcone synthase